MQLRVARLCLDCEELHNDNRCPRCASESYAFLSAWLHVEERRKWRRQPAAGPAASEGPWWSESPVGLLRTVGRWLGVSRPLETPGPATRAADRAAQLTFDDIPVTAERDTKVPAHHIRKA